MLVRVTCAGILIGSAELLPATGLAHAPLQCSEGYPIAQHAARAAALRVTATQYWSAMDGDFADQMAHEWPGDRLALEDAYGRELSVTVVVLDFPTPEPRPRVQVVADFRPDLARRMAPLVVEQLGGAGRTRPAA